jgi:hypothetical protein
MPSTYTSTRSFGQRVTDLEAIEGSQQAVADLLGVSKRTIRRYKKRVEPPRAGQYAGSIGAKVYSAHYYRTSRKTEAPEGSPEGASDEPVRAVDLTPSLEAYADNEWFGGFEAFALIDIYRAGELPDVARDALRRGMPVRLRVKISELDGFRNVVTGQFRATAEDYMDVKDALLMLTDDFRATVNAIDTEAGQGLWISSADMGEPVQTVTQADVPGLMPR